MSAIEIRRLSPDEIRACTQRGTTHCTAAGCASTYVYIAVYAQGGKTGRDLFCELHGSAWAAAHRRALGSVVAS
jgi:Rieske Fe-S protein